MSLNLIFRYPDLYHTAIAVAGLSNHRFYHAGFTERFMGLPKDNVEGYKDTAPMMFANSLKGNLLLIHGPGDDNVHHQNTEALVNELIAAKKRFTMMVYPSRSHTISEGPNTQYHLFDLMTWYLNENTPAGPKSR